MHRNLSVKVNGISQRIKQVHNFLWIFLIFAKLSIPFERYHSPQFLHGDK